MLRYNKQAILQTYNFDEFGQKSIATITIIKARVISGKNHKTIKTGNNEKTSYEFILAVGKEHLGIISENSNSEIIFENKVYNLAELEEVIDANGKVQFLKLYLVENNENTN